jgi:hypothetical protein
MQQAKNQEGKAGFYTHILVYFKIQTIEIGKKDKSINYKDRCKMKTSKGSVSRLPCSRKTKKSLPISFRKAFSSRI